MDMKKILQVLNTDKPPVNGSQNMKKFVGIVSKNNVPAGQLAVDEAAKKGLYHNVNQRKKAGTSRDASDPKAPTAQAWKDAAKTAKTEDAHKHWSFKDYVALTEANKKIKGVDGKACWDGHRYAGKEKKADGSYKDKCVKIKK